MPSGPPELHAKWKSDSNAVDFLERAGYKLTRDWRWVSNKPESKITDEEREAIWYLIVEWDYGGLVL